MTRLLALFLCLLAVTPPAFAWGALGHRLVGALAEDELTPAARRELATLLAGEAEPTLAGIATWADELRSSDPGLGRRSAPWHYVNLAEHDCGYDAARDCPRGDCVVEAINRQAARLADRTQPLEARRQALKFLVHFVGDVHQPLHAGYAHDKGGNTYQVSLPGKNGSDARRRGSNLHSLWDSGLLNDMALDEAAHLKRLRAMSPAPARSRASLRPDASAWAMQSCRVVLGAGFYPKDRRIGPAYARTWQPVVDSQLRQAGTRLAQTLNTALER
ncbi:MAG TPA: S1/P1 nuclease [Lysobacter sp.]